MSAYEVGDRVRVTYEGVVTNPQDKLTRRIELDGGDTAFCGASLPVYSADVTVLERRKPKVGDVVKGTERDVLPAGSIIRYAGPGYVKTLDAGWVDICSGKPYTVLSRSVPYTVAYIPD